MIIQRVFKGKCIKKQSETKNLFSSGFSVENLKEEIIGILYFNINEPKNKYNKNRSGKLTTTRLNFFEAKIIFDVKSIFLSSVSF